MCLHTATILYNTVLAMLATIDGNTWYAVHPGKHYIHFQSLLQLYNFPCFSAFITHCVFIVILVSLNPLIDEIVFCLIINFNQVAAFRFANVLGLKMSILNYKLKLHNEISFIPKVKFKKNTARMNINAY